MQAAETPLKKRSRKKFVRRKAEVEEEEGVEEEEERAVDNWIDDLQEKADEDVEMREVGGFL